MVAIWLLVQNHSEHIKDETDRLEGNVKQASKAGLMSHTNGILG